MTERYVFVYPNGDSATFAGVANAAVFADGSLVLELAGVEVVVAAGYRYFEVWPEGDPS